MKLQIEIPKIRASQTKETVSETTNSRLDMYFYPAKKQGDRYVPIGSNPVQFQIELPQDKKGKLKEADFYELDLPEIQAFSFVFALWENFDARSLAEEKKIFLNIEKECKEIPFNLQLSNTEHNYDISFKVIIDEEIS